MLKLVSIAVVLFASFALAQDKPTTAPSSETAEQSLKNSPRHGEWVDIAIPNSDAKLHTWIVYPETKDKAPVVIVIHEIYGMSDWVRAVTDQLAAEGFIAVAPDLLSGKGPDGGNTDSFKPNQVGAAIQKLSKADAAQRLDAARDYAIALPAASDKTATIGFCWGGSASFNYATHQPKLNAAVVYYGTPPDKDSLAKITCPIAAFYGQDDARVTSTVEPTKKLMSDLGKSYAPNIYEGAGHGFLRQQSARNGANQKAADQAWPATIAFLKKSLR